MKVEFINPFIESVNNLCTTMLGCKVERGDIGVADLESKPHEITALIGLSGPARGTVALTFPSETAMAMVGRMLGIDAVDIDATVTDGVGELVNIVAGNAKSKFVKTDGIPIDLSLPNVVKGDDYIVEYPSQTVWLEVPFKSDLGEFRLRVTFQMDGIIGVR